MGALVAVDWFEGRREALADLFELANDSSMAVSGYRELGRVLVARDGPAVIGHLQLIAGERAGEAEVKSLVDRPEFDRDSFSQILNLGGSGPSR